MMATEKRLIDANALIKDIDNYYHNSPFSHPGTTWLRGLELAVGLMLKAPTVDAVEVVHGRWERCGGDLHSSGYPVYCSICNRVHFVHYKYSLGGLNCKELFEKPKYCPSCGAVMEIEE